MIESARLLVDARPLHHPTAGGRGIGNYTAGLLRGLDAIGVPTTALVERPDVTVPWAPSSSQQIVPWSREQVRAFVRETGRWYVATGMFLHPISFDPIPRSITDAGLQVASVMYDVIPLRHPDLYLAEAAPRRMANLRATLARTVDVHLAISSFSAVTAIETLGLPKNAVAVIGAGCAPEFVPGTRGTRRCRTVVAITGPDPRKNTEGLLHGWSRVRPEVRRRRRLVVVSGGPASLLDSWRSTASRLGCASSVEFAGAVDGPRLVRLLQRAELAVQPSIEEGFGLPVLEAAACGVPGICSGVSALPEVLDEAAVTFDPRDPDDLARAIERGLTDPDHRSRLLGAARRAAARWTWERVAVELVSTLEARPSGPLSVSPAARVGVVGGSAALRLARTLGDAPMVDIVLLFGQGIESPGGSSGGGVDWWPLTALGPYVKYHELDAIIAVEEPGTASIDGQLASARRNLGSRSVPALSLDGARSDADLVVESVRWLQAHRLAVGVA